MQAKLKTQRQALDELWAQGLSGKSLLRNHSRLADQFIIDCLESVADKALSSEVALIALGGGAAYYVYGPPRLPWLDAPAPASAAPAGPR